MDKVNFFSRQEALRKVTVALLILTSVGSLGIGALGGGAAWLAYHGVAARQAIPIDPLQLRSLVSLGVVLTLGSSVIAVAVRLLLLHFNRAATQRYFQARQLESAVEHGPEGDRDRRLYNIVQEMSLASSLTLPKLLVLEEDASINSFALAPRKGRAILGVTAGARDLLTRDELQALVAHELAHIVNGDAAINIRLLALIHGFRWLYDMSVTIIGWPLRRFSSFKFGFFITFYLTMVFGVFFVLGLFGVGLARLMQAAIARRREYLADASAVQFTRATSGLLGALQKAGEVQQSKKRRPTQTAAFMMFVSPYRARSWLLRTHPKIADRVGAVHSMTPGVAVPA